MYEMVHKIIEILNALSTLVVAIFTVVMVQVFRNQSRATKIAERAWIVPDAQEPAPYEPDKILRHVILLKNTGRTTAWITAIGSRGKLVTSEDKLPQPPEYDMASPIPKNGTPLAPGGFVERPFWLTSAEAAQAETGELILYLFGIVRYRDVFGEEHETRFCFQFKPALGGTDPAMRDLYVGGPMSYLNAT